MKLLIKIIVFAVIFLFILNYFKDRGQEIPLVSFNIGSKDFSVKIREEEKNQLKEIAQKISGLVYHEATIHNPPGDMLPDQIDDNIKNEIKENIN